MFEFKLDLTDLFHSQVVPSWVASLPVSVIHAWRRVADSTAADYGYVLARTSIFDDFILKASRKQVLVFGAGYDSRALRLGVGEEVRFFGVDAESVLEFHRTNERFSKMKMVTSLQGLEEVGWNQKEPSVSLGVFIFIGVFLATMAISRVFGCFKGGDGTHLTQFGSQLSESFNGLFSHKTATGRHPRGCLDVHELWGLGGCDDGAGTV